MASAQIYCLLKLEIQNQKAIEQTIQELLQYHLPTMVFSTSDCCWLTQKNSEHPVRRFLGDVSNHPTSRPKTSPKHRETNLHQRLVPTTESLLRKMDLFVHEKAHLLEIRYSDCLLLPEQTHSTQNHHSNPPHTRHCHQTKMVLSEPQTTHPQ